MAPSGEEGEREARRAGGVLRRFVRLLILTLAPLLLLAAGAAIMLRGPCVLRVPRPPQREPASEERLRETVLFLTTTVHPRDYTRTDNLNRAAAWIAVTSSGPNPMNSRRYPLR